MGARFLAVLLLVVSPAFGGVTVLTQHNDSSRTGANLKEPFLTPANVNPGQFAKLFDLPVDGAVYAQPLYASGVSITGSPGTHNVVIVATEHDSVYAFDADGTPNAQPLWKVSFIDIANGISTVPATDVGTDDISPEIGITSTPVIDGASATLYVLAKTKRFNPANPGDQSAWSYEQKLHALDLHSGKEKANSPVLVHASVLGSGDGNDGNGIVPFDPLRQLNRPGLLLLNGVVYLAWASHGDLSPYHGWVIGYDKTSLAQVAVYNTTPNGGLGGIWMSGAGISADSAGNIFLATGNGTFDVDGNGAHIGSNFGNTVLRLATSGHGALSAGDFFTAYNQSALSQNDLDLGSGGVLLLPAQPGAYPRLAVTVGKDGTIYLLNRDSLGGYHPAYDAIVQELPQALSSSWSSPAYFDGSLYFHGGNDFLKRFPVWSGHLPSQPTSQGLSFFSFPGATPSVSANGNRNGIVWEIQWANPAVLIASDAKDLSNPLYTSSQAGNNRDVPGNGVKFAVPTVANGNVYVGCQDRVSVYGLIHEPSPLSVSIVGNGSVPPEFSGTTFREVNQNYSITATPGSGGILSGWRDLGSGLVISHSNTLTFVMRQNLALEADFVPNPFPAVAGNYSGLTLVQDSTRQWGGTGSFTVDSTGGFSGKVRLGADQISLHGSFLVNGTYVATMARPGKPAVTISLRVDLNGRQQITGTVSDGLLTGAVTANRAAGVGTSGPFTLVLAHPSDPSQPQGDGYGAGVVDSLGNLRFTGVLGDGSPVSQGTVVSAQGEWLLFAAPYGANGSITGNVSFENLAGSDLSGTLHWFKAASASSPGIASSVNAAGSFYDSNLAPVLGKAGSYTFVATGGGLQPSPSPVSFSLDINNKISILPGSSQLTLNFRLSNGIFTGVFTDAALRSRKYSGVVMQKASAGNGLFKAAGKAGAIRIAQ